MRRSRALGVATAVAVAGAMVLTFSPTQGSDAQWRETVTAPATGPTSDTFAMTATGSDGAAPTWPGSGGIANSSQITLKNGSARHSSWVNVQSTSVKKAVTPDVNTVLARAKIDYRFGAGSCTADYGNARGAGAITEGTTYNRKQDKVTGATLAPGQTGVLCPVIGLNYTGANAQRDALLNHAGRALDITTVVNQRSESPATWSSANQTLTSRYRVAMPAPTKPADFPVCRRTFSNGRYDGGGGLFGGFFWGWPDASTSDHTTTTPAMAGGWEVFRRNAAGAWSSWQPSVNSGNDRQRAGVNSNNISDDGQPANAVRQFKLRGYPFADDKSRYVESTWIAQAHEQIGRWACDPMLTNPNAGPHNMP